MPMLWRYLMRQYVQVFLLCVVAFIGVLLVMRLQDIARFATLGATLGTVLLFSLYQIPYILPLAVPISSMIAALLLFRKMSESHELTSIRAAGVSIYAIASPIFCISCFFALGNFAIASDATPYARAKAQALIFGMTTRNPLVLLHKDSLVPLKGAYLDVGGLTDHGKAQDVVLIAKNTANDRIGLMVAKELVVVDGGQLIGKEVAFISSLDPKIPNRYDHLVVENQRSMAISVDGLSRFWEDATWQMHSDYLPLRLLIAREIVEKGGLFSGISKLHIECVRRLFLAFAVCTFTVIGVAYGVHIGRSHDARKLIWAICLAGGLLLCFITAKSFKASPWIGLALYILPHPIALFLSFRALQHVQYGREV